MARGHETPACARSALNTLHRGITGAGYAARHPELALWVHATLIDSTIVTNAAWLGPLSVDRRAAFYAETRPIGRAFGGPESLLPADLDAFERYLAGMLAATGPARSRYAQSVSTFAELGVKGLELRDWFGLFIVGKPAPEVLARVAPLVRAALASPRYTQGLVTLLIEPAASSPEEVDRMVRDDYERWGGIVRASGFVADT